ncbi:amidohydrolase family protein [Latilactobacillus curvatus]|uniref:amidohydrolase family protein n=1 Tax=Latilactobacillus curvatus TaxID=28038 RepID=UPI000230F09C|nr:amidohydrolase family protein [Latilactobacillus curvatus]EHE85478.1 adenine deaminase domain protein [Latilactobacillus curvatus CRL 705]WRS45900.1 amidohydrolase family protein [Latilactobacillus curvatus]
MDKPTLKQLIDQAAGRQAADMVIKNAKVVDVYNGRIIEGTLAIGNGRFLGISDDYLAPKVIDARGQYVVPGLIDPHIHIESANVSPAVFGSLVTPHGTTTILADPHEIVNVAGMRGLNTWSHLPKRQHLISSTPCPRVCLLLIQTSKHLVL